MHHATELTGTDDWERSTLVPPRRLGNLLSEARARRGLTLEEAAAMSDGRFSLSTLSSIERGSRPVTDQDARVLAEVYGLESSSLVPARSKLIVDLGEGVLTVDDRTARVGRVAPARDEVLARYLTMVYSMRQAEPGTPLVLRVDDLDVLGRALRVGGQTLAADLDALMANPRDLLGWRSRVLKRRVLIPAAGVLVALMGVGALVLVQGQQPADANEGAPSPSTTLLPTSHAGVALDVPTDIGSAVVQERLADGTPGPVVIRQGDGVGSTTTSVPAEVGLIAPASTVVGEG